MVIGPGSVTFSGRSVERARRRSASRNTGRGRVTLADDARHGACFAVAPAARRLVAQVLRVDAGQAFEEAPDVVPAPRSPSPTTSSPAASWSATRAARVVLRLVAAPWRRAPRRLQDPRLGEPARLRQAADDGGAKRPFMSVKVTGRRRAAGSPRSRRRRPRGTPARPARWRSGRESPYCALLSAGVFTV